jgi:hypothetical protein
VLVIARAFLSLHPTRQIGVLHGLAKQKAVDPLTLWHHADRHLVIYIPYHARARPKETRLSVEEVGLSVSIYITTRHRVRFLPSEYRS